jgi:hypothetical protein
VARALHFEGAVVETRPLPQEPFAELAARAARGAGAERDGLRAELLAAGAFAGVDDAALLAAARPLAAGVDETALLREVADARDRAGDLDAEARILARAAGTAAPAARAAIDRRRAELALAAGDPRRAAELLAGAVAVAAGTGDEALAGATADAARRAADEAHQAFGATGDLAHALAARRLYAALAAVRTSTPRALELTERSADLELRIARSARRGGEPSASLVKAAIRRQLPRLQGCHARALLADPALAGEVTLHLYVGPDGRVEAVDSTPPAGDAGLPALAACAADVARRVVFARLAYSGRIAVHYSVDFVVADAAASSGGRTSRNAR